MKALWLWTSALIALLAPAAMAQQPSPPRIGYVYPAGGKQGTTVQIRLGGQGLDEVCGVVVSGPGVDAKLVEYFKRLGNTESGLITEQLNILKRQAKAEADKKAAAEKKEAAAKRPPPARRIPPPRPTRPPSPTPPPRRTR